MRLIDADKLNKPVYAEDDNITGAGMSYAEMDGYNDAIDMMWNYISSAPTIDAVPVIRCKDCLYRNKILCPMIHKTLSNGLIDYAVDDGYCNRSKRKGEI